jgi:uncharacterized protein YjgD (DUF1641 family)
MSEPEREAQEMRNELERVMAAARDSVTDDIVARLAESAAQTMELLDRLNRSGAGQAIPAIAQMVDNGDLERLVSLARVYGSAEDALTDDMVGRLSETVGGGLDLLDQVNRANLSKALPVLSQMVANGDLERVVNYVRIIGAAEDALTDDMVGRFAETIGEALSLVDRLNRSGVVRLVEVLEQLNASGALAKLADQLPRLIESVEMLGDMMNCLQGATQAAREQPPAHGGIFEMLHLLRDPENMKFIRFALDVGKRMQASCMTRTP